MTRIGWEKKSYIIALSPIFMLTGLVMYLISASLIPEITKLPVGSKVLIGVFETVFWTTLFVYIVKKRLKKQGN